MAVIEIKNLTKKYGYKNAISNVSFKVEKGEVLGFLGPNGAGKSTTLNIITGYITATSGEISITKGANVGYLPEVPPLYNEMTVAEYLEFVYDLKKIKLDKRKHVEEIMSKTKVDDVARRIIKNLSKGYKQRVGIAQALIGNPEIIILDEPTVGLDPKQIIEIRKLIRELSSKHTIILSSHIMQEIEAVADKIVIIDEGKIVAQGSLAELAQKGENLEKVFLRVTGVQEEEEPSKKIEQKLIDPNIMVQEKEEAKEEVEA